MFFRNWYLCTLLCLIVGGSNKMHPGGNYQDFLKWGRDVCFRSFSYNNWINLRVFFPKKYSLSPSKIKHKRVYNLVLFIYFVLLFINWFVHTCAIMYIFLHFVVLIICNTRLLFAHLFVYLFACWSWYY